MSHDLPDDWYIEETGERLILDQGKVAAEIGRLRAALTEIRDYGHKAASDVARAALNAVAKPERLG